jgi:hypothetical protein
MFHLNSFSNGWRSIELQEHVVSMTLSPKRRVFKVTYIIQTIHEVQLKSEEQNKQ